MVFEENAIERRNRIKAAFVCPNAPLRELPESERVGSIYVITNLRNGKRYVGQTKDFNRRVSEYIRYGDSRSLAYRSRVSKMYRIIRDEGIQNFVIQRVYDCQSYDELSQLERETILKLQTILPQYGYNSNADLDIHYDESDDSRLRRSISHMGVQGSVQSRVSRSLWCIAINLDTKHIVKADSLALFGERVLSTTKDIIAAAARRGNRIKGYYVVTEPLIRRIQSGSRIWCNHDELCHIVNEIIPQSDEELMAQGCTIQVERF